MQKFSNRSSVLHLLVFPVAFLVIQVLLKIDFRWYFLSNHDPAYGFLFNGLNIAQGNLQLGLSGFPGTTLQCLVALNIRIIHLFAGGGPLATAVLANPELYLNIVSIEMVTGIALTLYFTGRYVFRHTQNLPLALALQLTPFISQKAFSMNAVVMLEPLMLIFELLLMAILARYVWGTEKVLHRKTVVWMALLVALGMATKTVFLPVVVLPFFMISGVRQQLLYGAVVVVATAILLIPIYPTFSTFIAWYKLISTHTGIYGSGEYALFDLQVYLHNLVLIFQTSALFSITFLLVIVTLPLYWFFPSNDDTTRKKRKVLTGIAVVFLLNVLMVARHFAMHYLVISYNFTVLGFILWLTVFPFKPLQQGIQNLKPWLKISGIYLAGTLLLVVLVQKIQFSPSFINPRLNSFAFVRDTVKRHPRIIILEHPGPFIETALYHGMAYSNGMKPAYANQLKKQFPESYFLNLGTNSLHDWVHEYPWAEALSHSQRNFLFYRSTTDTLPGAVAIPLRQLMQQSFVRAIQLAYYGEAYNEYIYVLDTDTALLKKYMVSHTFMQCDFESLRDGGEGFLTSDTAFSLSGGILQTTETAFSGCRSVKLDRNNPYGPGLSFKAAKGIYEVSVMRSAADNSGLLVAADTLGRLYKANGIATGEINGWETVRLNVVIPEELSGEVIKVYLWYPGKAEAYFDDLRITFTATP